MPGNIGKNNVFKTWPSQNQPAMMPTKWRFFLFVKKNHNTLLSENIEKNMYLRRDQGKITLLWCPKNGDIFYL